MSDAFNISHEQDMKTERSVGISFFARHVRRYLFRCL